MQSRQGVNDLIKPSFKLELVGTGLCLGVPSGCGLVGRAGPPSCLAPSAAQSLRGYIEQVVAGTREADVRARATMQIAQLPADSVVIIESDLVCQRAAEAYSAGVSDTGRTAQTRRVVVVRARNQYFV